MRVHVKFFAIFREMVGIKDEWVPLDDGATVESLWKQYATRSPRVGDIRAAYAVNQKLVKPEHVLCDGDEVGFLPPVSGGASRGTKSAPKARASRTKARPKRVARRPRKISPVSISRRKLDLGALIRCVEFPAAGAILTFSGVVRDNAKGKSVGHLEYEAYPEMAENSMREIIAEIAERWPEARVAMAHRIGRLKVGEASLIIAVAAPHRPEAYAASRYAIERIKAMLPVWKKEFAADGEYWVEGPVAGELTPAKAEQVVRDAEYTPF